MQLRSVSLILALCLFSLGFADDEWRMASKDEAHTGSSSVGAKPPLRRSWREPTPSRGDNFVAWPVVVDGMALAKFDSGLIAVEASSGRRVWFRHFEEGHSIGVPAVEGDRVFSPLYNGTLVAINLTDGKDLWRFKAENEIEHSPTVADGRVFFGSTEAKKFYAVNSATGSLVWEQTSRYEPHSVPAVASNQVVYTTQDLDSENADVIAAEADTGRILWTVPQKEASTSPSILGEKVILGGGDFYAHALDLKTGRSIWKAPVKGKFGPRNLPALAFGDVFLADRIGNIYRLDGDTGKQKWIFEDAEEGTFDQSFPVIAGKTLFIGSNSGWLYALHTDTGRLLWKEQVGGFVLSGAADSERFYFGVKFRNEGLYAYEHDPNGKLEPPPSEPTQQIVAGVLLFAILVGGVWLYGRRRRSAD